MKRLIFFSWIALIFLSANAFTIQVPDTSKLAIVDTTVNDSLNYELLVFDPGFEGFLISQPPMWYYSEEYYKTWNTQYVSEWNNRFKTQVNNSLYDDYIDYNYFVKYGISLEYRLYYYFRFFEEKNHIILIKRAN